MMEMSYGGFIASVKTSAAQGQAPLSASVPPPERLGFLDWARGIATMVMLQGHVWESFTDKNLRDHPAYVFSQFPGGVAPAVFLFLVGVTLALMIDGRERKGVSGVGRMWAAVKRAMFLGGLALLFRLQMYVFYYPHGAWTDLLKVDILNCMAATILMLSPMAAMGRVGRIRGALFITALIAFGAPLVSMYKGYIPAGLVRSYLAPDNAAFSLFPWGTFVALGMACGTALRLIPSLERGPVMQFAGWLGFALVIFSQYLSNLPYSIYENAQFWLDSPALTMIKCGVILMVMTFAYFYNEWMPQMHEAANYPLRFSVPKQLGKTSLFIYWVHIEIVYGRLSENLRMCLPIWGTALAAILVVVFMILLSYGKSWLVEQPFWRAWVARWKAAVPLFG